MSDNGTDRAFLGFGGNLGDPLTLFRHTRTLLNDHDDIRVTASSPLYQTPAIGGPENQPDYLNAVVEIETGIRAENLLHLCHRIEDDAGRTREVHWGPRPLDIDLLFFGPLVADNPQLTLPHPRLHQRHFVLLPLNDLAADFRHPQLNLSVAELLNRLPEATGIIQLQKVW